jgi:hypothetical protein
MSDVPQHHRHRHRDYQHPHHHQRLQDTQLVRQQRQTMQKFQKELALLGS